MMIAIAMMLETAIPTRVSMRMRRNSFLCVEGSSRKGFFFESVRWFSASSDDRLPDEKIGRNRRSENRHQRREEGSLPLNLWDQQAFNRFRPRHFDYCQGDDVGKQNERQPFENADVAFVFEKHLREHRNDAEQEHVDDRRPADQQFDGIAHRAQVRRDVDGVCDEKQGNERPDDRRRIVSADVAGDAMASDATDPSGDLLNGDHQRVGQQHGPTDAEAELRAGLAVGPDARGIVVRCTGDQARSEALQKTVVSLG
jgi:hypothetical protein